MSAQDARSEILGRVRAALADRPEVPQAPWTYGRPVGTGELDVVERFAERVADYQAIVERVAPAEVGAAIASALAGASARRVLADETLREAWPSEATVEWVADTGLTATDLDRVDAVITTATVGISNTGTIMLDHRAGQGRRAATLVPDVHVCVVEADQIVGDVPEAVARLVEIGSHTRPSTWISGPSATSDIELSRVEGVHGPRTLHVIIAG